jgi:DUF1680 family protein
VRVTKTDDRPWSITLRVPQWTQGAELVTTYGRRHVSAGDIVVYRKFAVGEEIRLELPMRPRFTAPDPRIDATRGCVAVERGPLVYCAEAVDDVDLDSLRVNESVPPVDTAAGVAVRARFDAPAAESWPYGRAKPRSATTPTTSLDLVPYHRWARRGPSTMRVWLPTT